MQFNYITERPYRGLTEDQIYEHGSYFTYPNAAFDAQLASDDYNAYLDEAVLAEKVGFDGVGLNEHHANPFCMGAVLNVEAAVLARITERVRIVLIGNPIPAHRNPMRLAGAGRVRAALNYAGATPAPGSDGPAGRELRDPFAGAFKD
ncbi:MAG: LLM class flavin-dependent oxidoreductase [Caulobacter sp.]|nr:LLM class flavin-dependent oxidoreductase [Caulobacter sp.]